MNSRVKLYFQQWSNLASFSEIRFYYLVWVGYHMHRMALIKLKWLRCYYKSKIYSCTFNEIWYICYYYHNNFNPAKESKTTGIKMHNDSVKCTLNNLPSFEHLCRCACIFYYSLCRQHKYIWTNVCCCCCSFCLKKLSPKSQCDRI